MACVIDLGADTVCELRMRVFEGAAWTSQPMTRSDEGEWSPSLRLVFSGDITWTATLTDANKTATLHATDEQVEAVDHRELVTLRDDTRIYATGHVTVLEGPV